MINMKQYATNEEIRQNYFEKDLWHLYKKQNFEINTQIPKSVLKDKESMYQIELNMANNVLKKNRIILPKTDKKAQNI